MLPSARGRIIAGFGLLVLILAAGAAGSAWLTREHRSDMAEMQKHIATTSLLQDTQVFGALALSELQRYLANGDETAASETRAYLATAADSLADARAQEEMRGDEDEIANLDEIMAGTAFFSETAEQVIALRQSGDMEGAVATLEAATPQLQQSGLEIDQATEFELQEVDALRSRADRTGDLAFWFAIIAGVMGAALGLAASALIVRSILKPLSSLESTALAVAGGDLSARAPATGPRELARLGASLNRMTESLLDASKRRELEAELRESEEKFRELLESAPDACVIVNTDGHIVLVNAQTEKMFGYKRAELIGEPVEMLVPQRFQEAHVGYRTGYSSEPSTRPMGAGRELAGRRKDGSEFPVEISLSTMETEDGVLVTSIVHDVSERKQAEEAIRHLAYHDSLTDLPNRASFQEHLAVALAQNRRKEEIVAVLFLDLDHFKVVNDTAGHAEGDRLLRSVAERLRRVFREGDVVARVGGDEFTILLPDISGAQDATQTAERVLAAVRQQWILNGREFQVTTSIGVAICPTDGEDAQTLLMNADTALYRAKDAGRDRIEFYAAGMHAEVADLAALEADLRRALHREEFVLHYQPVADVNTGQTTGVEALVRWQHPERGLLNPMEFIPVAERTGLIVPLGEWVLRSACAQYRAWREAGLDPERLAVNFSARQFRDPSLFDMIAGILEDTVFDPRHLQIEITEQTAMDEADSTLAIFGELKILGVQIALDDFGTGHSSLAYLRRFPVDAIKIDRSFVSDVTSDPDDAAITSTIIAMAHTLGLKVIAEGIETQEQLDFLRKKQCDEFQGYLFRKPILAEEIETMLRQDRRSRVPAGGRRGQR